jgi:hypothetical protein
MNNKPYDQEDGYQHHIIRTACGLGVTVQAIFWREQRNLPYKKNFFMLRIA